jgi:hypothetical protein
MSSLIVACAQSDPPGGKTVHSARRLQQVNVIARIRFRRDHRWVPAHASDYIDEELPGHSSTRVERHLRDCPDCRELLAGLTAIVGGLGSMRNEAGGLVASAVLSNVRSRLSELP